MNSSLCLIDTSIFLEILNVPGKANQHQAILTELKQKIEAQESLFLPMATIFETGNHIAQNGNGAQRRQCAECFAEQVTQALDGQSPFTPLSFPEPDDIRDWLKKFPDSAMRGLGTGKGTGIGDLSIIHDWEIQRKRHSTRRVYIWTLDRHLSSYNPAT